MASALKNLSDYDSSKVPSANGLRFGVVVSEWNTEITEALFNGVNETLLKFGAAQADIIRRNVPGSFELTLGGQLLAETKQFDAIICIGVVIQGDTKHFDFICDAVAKGITDLNIKYNIPVIFGVLTPNTMQQAIDRAGGIHGNKGDEAAITAIKMAALKKELEA